MTALVAPDKIDLSLPALVDRAVQALANARTSAEVLDARDLAAVAYDAAKRAARIGKAKQAHDSLIAAAHRTQADALEIEAQAKRRLADEYDAAQERGEVGKAGGDRKIKIPDRNFETTGVPPKELHEARQVRDAEQSDPGIVRRTLDEALDAGEEPTRAKVKRAVKAKSKRTRKPRGYHSAPAVEETQHDRDLRMLLGMWDAACDSARQEFLQIIETRG